VRRACPADHKRELLTDQGYVCIYCAETFGSVVRRARGLTVTSVHYDHAVPLAYLNANPRWNWVAACSVCNQIKHAKMFRSIPEIRFHVLERREKTGRKVEWLAPVSSEYDPERWAIAFATYLSILSYWDAEKVKASPVLKLRHFKTALGTALSALEEVTDHTPSGEWIAHTPTDTLLVLGAGPPVAWASQRKGPWPWSK
jgi:5-methylcytosine-specific restriction endonuclease McrA